MITSTKKHTKKTKNNNKKTRQSEPRTNGKNKAIQTKSHKKEAYTYTLPKREKEKKKKYIYKGRKQTPSLQLLPKSTT